MNVSIVTKDFTQFKTRLEEKVTLPKEPDRTATFENGLKLWKEKLEIVVIPILQMGKDCTVRLGVIACDDIPGVSEAAKSKRGGDCMIVLCQKPNGRVQILRRWQRSEQARWRMPAVSAVVQMAEVLAHVETCEHRPSYEDLTSRGTDYIGYWHMDWDRFQLFNGSRDNSATEPTYLSLSFLRELIVFGISYPQAIPQRWDEVPGRIEEIKQWVLRSEREKRRKENQSMRGQPFLQVVR